MNYLLIEATRKFDIESVRTILSSKSEESNLMTAIELCCVKTVDLLLRYRDDPNERDTYGNTPLIEACRSGCTDIVSLLLTYGADANMKSESDTPLGVAVRGRHYNIISLLLSNGANIDERCMLGKTVLHEAVSLGDEAIVSLLLERGANPNIEDERGSTPVLYCRDVDILYRLIESNIDINVCDDQESTLLHLSIMSKNVDMIRALLDNNVGLNSRDVYGRTPLMYAVWKIMPDMVSLLLERGADPTLKDKNGDTALVYSFDDDITSILEREL